MSQKDEKKFFENFKEAKSLVSSPELSKPTPMETEISKNKEGNDKPYLSDQAKLLLEELHKYKSIYKPNSENISNAQPSKSKNSGGLLSEKARQIFEEYKFPQKKTESDSKEMNIDLKKVSPAAQKDQNNDTNSNYYSLTEPFTFEARDFDSNRVQTNNDQIQEKNIYEQTSSKKEAISSGINHSTPDKAEETKTEKDNFPTNNKEEFTPNKPIAQKNKYKVLEVDLNKPVGNMSNNKNEKNIEKPVAKVFEVNVNNTSNTKVNSLKNIESNSKASSKALPMETTLKNKIFADPSSSYKQAKEDPSNKVNYMPFSQKEENLNDNQFLQKKQNPFDALKNAHQVKTSVETVIRKDSNNENKDSSFKFDVPTPFTLDQFQKNENNTPFSSSSNLNNNLIKTPDIQRYWSQQPKFMTEPSHSNDISKDRKLKGFQIQIDNIINNCFSSFINRSILNQSPSKPTSSFLFGHKTGNSQHSSQGFMTLEEKQRQVPFFDNLGKDMDVIIKKIKTQIAEKTESYTKNYHGEAELRKSRFINEIQQAVKASLQELESHVPNSDRMLEMRNSKKDSFHPNFEPKSVQTGEKTPMSLKQDCNNHFNFNSPSLILPNNNKNIISPINPSSNSLDRDVIEEIVKKTTNEMIMSLMKSNLLETPLKKQDLSRSVEDLKTFKEGSLLTTNFQKKKEEILNQIEYLDKEIVEMEKRNETLDQSIDKNSVEAKNSFLSSPLELPDPYFKPRIKTKQPSEINKKLIVKGLAKTQSISHNANPKMKEVRRVKSPAPPITTQKVGVDFLKKKIASSRLNQKENKQSFNSSTGTGLGSFEERNRKWLEQREMKIMKSKERMEGVLKECTFKPMSFTRNPLVNISKGNTTVNNRNSPLKNNEKYSAHLETTPVKRKAIATLPIKVSVVNNTMERTHNLKKVLNNLSIEKPSQIKKNNLFERRKILTEKKNQTLQDQKKAPMRNLSGFQKTSKNTVFSKTQPISNLKNVKALKTVSPSVFMKSKNKKDETAASKKIPLTGHNKRNSPLKSPKSSNKNETSIEESFKKRADDKEKSKKGEMKELIGVLINLTKTLNEKNQNGTENGSEKTLTEPAFEMNIKAVFPNDIEREKILNSPKLEGFEEMEKIVTERELTERVNRELTKDEDEDEDLLNFGGKNINLDKFNTLLGKANALSEQIQKAFRSSEDFN